MTTGVSAIDKAMQKTRIWLNDLAEELGWTDLDRAYSALRAVLHALRDRLMVGEAMDLGAQMPTLIRGFFFEGWDAAKPPVRTRTKSDFLAAIAETLPGIAEAEIERVTKGVFHLLARRVTGGEIEDVRQMLPEAVRKLWTLPETRLEQAAPVPQRRPGLRRAKLRQMRREIRRIVARARAEGVPEEELPVLQSRRRLRASRGQKSYGVRRRRISG